MGGVRTGPNPALWEKGTWPGPNLAPWGGKRCAPTPIKKQGYGPVSQGKGLQPGSPVCAGFGDLAGGINAHRSPATKFPDL